MQAITALFSGLGYALQLIVKRRLFAWFIPAILVSIVFYYTLVGGAALGERLDFMSDWWLVGWLLKSSKSFFSLIAFMLFEFLILTLLSPINSMLAEKAREDLTGIKTDFSMAVFLRSLRRMLVILLTGFVFQFGLMAILWFFSFLFGDLFYEIASLLNLAFFIGFSFYDFTLELDEVDSRSSWKYARKNWLKCIALGLVFNVCTYYPQKHDWFMIYLAGMSLTPPLLAIAAAKMYYSEKEKA